MAKKKKSVDSAAIPTSATSAQEAKWRAESDARALAEAEAIKADKERMKKAQRAAQTMAKDKRAEATAMTKIAGGKMSAQQKFESIRLKQGAKRY